MRSSGWCPWAICNIQYDDRYIGGLAQDCSIPIANALEILQSCTKSYERNIYIYTYLYERNIYINTIRMCLYLCVYWYMYDILLCNVQGWVIEVVSYMYVTGWNTRGAHAQVIRTISHLIWNNINEIRCIQLMYSQAVEDIRLFTW